MFLAGIRESMIDVITSALILPIPPVPSQYMMINKKGFEDVSHIRKLGASLHIFLSNAMNSLSAIQIRCTADWGFFEAQLHH